MPVSVHMCVWLCASESRRDYSAICDFADWSEQPVAPCPDEEMDRWMSACASWAFYDLPCLSVIEKVAWLCCLGIFPPSIMQLQNRKTNSGNRPPNVINFVGVGGEGWGGLTGYYYCRRKNSNQLQIPSCLVSVTVANYKWTLCYSFTSCATQRMDWGRHCRALAGRRETEENRGEGKKG